MTSPNSFNAFQIKRQAHAVSRRETSLHTDRWNPFRHVWAKSNSQTVTSQTDQDAFDALHRKPTITAPPGPHRSEADLEVGNNSFASRLRQLNKLFKPQLTTAPGTRGEARGIKRGLQKDVNSVLGIADSKADTSADFSEKTFVDLDSRKDDRGIQVIRGGKASIINVQDVLTAADDTAIQSHNIKCDDWGFDEDHEADDVFSPRWTHNSGETAAFDPGDTQNRMSPRELSIPESRQDKAREHRLFKNVKPREPLTFAKQLQKVLLNSWFDILLVLAPVGIILGAILNMNKYAMFIVDVVAVIPLAALVDLAIDEIALRTGETLGGLLNALFGVVEMIVAVVAPSGPLALLVLAWLIQPASAAPDFTQPVVVVPGCISFPLLAFSYLVRDRNAGDEWFQIGICVGAAFVASIYVFAIIALVVNDITARQSLGRTVPPVVVILMFIFRTTATFSDDSHSTDAVQVVNHAIVSVVVSFTFYVLGGIDRLVGTATPDPTSAAEDLEGRLVTYASGSQTQSQTELQPTSGATAVPDSPSTDVGGGDSEQLSDVTELTEFVGREG